MYVPVCINRKLAVQYSVLLILLPIAVLQFSYHHPSCIFGTTVIIPVDKEVTFIMWTVHWSIDGKVVVRLSWNIKPGALSQSRAREPVVVVWSCSFEFQLLLQFSACIERNSSLLKSQTNQLVMQLDKIEICVWCRTRFCTFPRLYGENLSRVEGHPSSRVNFSERMRKKLTPSPKVTKLAHALIVSAPWPWWSDRASVYMEKSWPG